MKDQKVLRELIHLYKIIDAGEKGFATAAANTPNQGTKLLLKTYARQRAGFKDEILAELQLFGKGIKPGTSIPGMIHRGRVAIFGAMTIEEERRERVVLKEASMGERVAVRTYQKILKENLPAPTRNVIERQLVEVRKASEQIKLLRGIEGNQLILNLFNSDNQAAVVIQALQSAGFPPAAIEKISIRDMDLYEGRGATITETLLSGAFGGALWGGLTGIMVGFGVLQTISPAPVGIAAILSIWSLVTLGYVLLGIFIAAFLAFFIGVGISDQDLQLVRQIKERSQFLVRILTNKNEAAKVHQILNQGDQISGASIKVAAKNG